MPTKRIDRSFSPDSPVITFTELASGQSVTADVSKLLGDKVKWDDLPDIAKRMLLHGANAKYGDSASSPRDPAIPTIQEAINQVEGGVWYTRSSGGPRVTDTVLALHSVLSDQAKKVGAEPPSLDTVADRYDSLSAEDKKALPKKYPAVALEKARIAEERQKERKKKLTEEAKGADTSGLSDLFAPAA